MSDKGTQAPDLTAKEQRALDYLRLAKATCDTTDDGVLTSEATFYDGEIDVAYVNFKTARSLVRKGFITYGDYDPDGTALCLVSGSLPGRVRITDGTE